MSFQLVRRAVLDLRANLFLTTMTVVTMALSILVVSTVVLFLENTGRLMASWNSRVSLMVYLRPGLGQVAVDGLKQSLTRMGERPEIRFISRAEALDALKQDLSSRDLSLEGLQDNPLPDALEMTVSAPVDGWAGVRALAGTIQGLANVEEVEYGQEWVTGVVGLFMASRKAGLAVAGLFCAAALLITASTVRLSLHSRHEEVEIMRLVGATDRFIMLPFHVEGLLQGLAAGVLGTGLLLAGFVAVTSGTGETLLAMTGIALEFISLEACVGLILFSGFLGWFGSYLSLKQILA
jgi:cell division transport system permease protein